MSGDTPDNLYRILGRIEGNVEGIKDELKKGAGKFEKQDKRLRTIEKRQYWYAGVVATIAVIATPIAKKIGLI